MRTELIVGDKRRARKSDGLQTHCNMGQGRGTSCGVGSVVVFGNSTAEFRSMLSRRRRLLSRPLLSVGRGDVMLFGELVVRATATTTSSGNEDKIEL